MEICKMIDLSKKRKNINQPKISLKVTNISEQQIKSIFVDPELLNFEQRGQVLINW